MFGDKNDRANESGITLVATNCEMVGDVHFSDELIVNGTVKGNIYAQPGSKAVVKIHEKGRVRGEIRVPYVIVNGKVFGDIRSDKHIELSAKAEVKGNVYYHLIEMVKGSRVDGHLVHAQDGKKDAKEPPLEQEEQKEQKEPKGQKEPKKEAKATEKTEEASVAPVAAVPGGQ